VHWSQESSSSLLRWRLGLLWTFKLWVRWALFIGCGFTGFLWFICPLLGEGKKSWEHFAHQPCGRSIRPCISSLGCRNVDLELPLRVQECRSLTPEDAGMIVLSMGDGMLTHLP
jgi:hypothetical protein